MSIFTERLKSRMAELGMTQNQLAEALGCPLSTIFLILQGEHLPTVDRLKKLESALGLQPGELYKDL